MASITLSVIAAFFPPSAKNEQGISEDMVGLIYSAKPIAVGLAVFIVGKS